MTGCTIVALSAGPFAFASGPAAVAGRTVSVLGERAVAARRFGSDLPGALTEDAPAALVSRLGARRRNAEHPSGG